MQLSLLNRKRLLMSVLVVFATACMQLSYARDISVPESLKPWEDWVSERHEELGCPIEATKGSQLSCGWFNKLVVHVSLDRPNHSSFRLHGEAFSETSIGLPHTSSRRPHDVRLNGRPALLGVRANGSTPIVHVTTGAYVIEGKLAFETLPSYINVPKQLSIVQLIVDEEVVSQPRFEDGQLWLTERTIDERSPVQNTLNIAVFRKLTDSVPQRLVTRLKLAASGQPRTVNIGKVIPDGFIVTQIRSDNPLQLNEDDSFLVKVAPGSSRIEIESQNYTVQNEFTFSSSAESWPNSEIWAFASVNNHRIVSVDGVQAVEPTIVYSPYTEVANYRLPTGDTLSLVDERRGNLHPGSVALDLHREIWLAFDGSTFRVKENLNVESTKDQRIEAHHPLGSLKVNGFVTMITQLSEKSESNGVNLVETNSEIETISDLGPDRTISAVGWNRDAESLSMVLNLPPGWLLLHASGVDVVKDSWLSRWGNLWDIFLCVLVIVVMYKIGGPLLATITGIALLLGYQEQWYTAVGWLVLGLLCLLTRTLGSDKLRITQLTIYWLVLVPVIVATLFVSVTNVRQAFYTQLETPYEQVRPHVSFSGERTSTIARKTLDVESPEIEALVVSGNFLEPDESVNDDLRYPILQTGTALPDWSWRTINLDWSGSVSEHHTLDLILSPPLLTKAVYLLIALLHLIILVFFIVVQVGRNWRWPPWLSKVLPFLVLSFVTPNVSAEFPTTELLDELESRLTAPPSCLPQCASLDRVVFRTSEQDLLKVELDWSSLEAVAVPLPTSNYSASLSSVTVDNQPAPLQLIKGKSLLPLAPGSQKVNMEFDLVGLDQFVITFPFTPALIEEDHCCWQTSVLSDEKKSSIVFNRSRKVEATEEGTTSFEEIALHTDAVLERTLIFDFEPKVVTELRRRNELSDVSTFSVPLLEGETVLDAEANIQDGHNVITFTPGQRWVEWTSRFEPSKSIELIAPSHEQWVERWRIIGSNFWQLKASGIPSSPNRDEKIGTMFYPRQGEQLTIVIHPLSPADRETVTIQSTSLSLTPGSRESVGKLQFVVQAGEAGEIEVTLPESARVLKIEVDSEMVPSTPSNDVVLPIKRGRSTYVVEWSEESSLSLFYRTPSIELSSPASNIDINLTYPANRWILLLGGPTIGVAILFWGVVLVTVVLAWLLALLPKFPFTKLDAVLLAAGATLANIWALLFVAGWLVSIWWRSRNTLAGLSNVKYRLAQIGFIFLALIGVFALFMTVLSALQTPASMFMVQSPMADFRHLIGANWTMQLHWFSDFTQAELPTAWVFSLPFWVYQLTMLAWSLWLVSALFRWVRSSFSAISEPTLWRSEAEYLPEEDEKKEVSPTGSSDTWQETNPEPERT